MRSRTWSGVPTAPRSEPVPCCTIWAARLAPVCEAAGHALLRLDGRVVAVDPLLGLFGFDERERQGADALLGGQLDGLPAAARHPHRRVRLLQGVAVRPREATSAPSASVLADLD